MPALTALLAALAIGAAGCTSLGTSTTVSNGPGAPTGALAAPPTGSGAAPVEAAGSAPDVPGGSAPDVPADPLPSSSALSTTVPAAPLSPAPGAASLVLHVPVLMYHRVVPPAQAGDTLPALNVPPDLFAAQMDALAAAGWHTITAARLARDLAGGIRPAPKTFVITFDDGYDDGFTQALPILRAHHFVATFYVIAGRIGEASSAPDVLTAAHVRALAAAGMEIGNHTFSHAGLGTLPLGTVRHQIVAASLRIEQLVGVPPLTLAYPYGSWNGQAAAEVAAAGMAMAFTTVEGALETWPNRLWAPRVRVGPGTAPAELVGLVTRFGG